MKRDEMQRLDIHSGQRPIPLGKFGSRFSLRETKQKICENKRFVKYLEWPPTSSDCNPLDYYFWEKVQRKGFENRFNRTFENENALKRQIRRVWLEVSRDIEEIRKALKEFVPCLKSVNEEDGQCSKMLFG